jgi:hypothetical protein
MLLSSWASETGMLLARRHGNLLADGTRNLLQDRRHSHQLESLLYEAGASLTSFATFITQISLVTLQQP